MRLAKRSSDKNIFLTNKVTCKIRKSKKKKKAKMKFGEEFSNSLIFCSHYQVREKKSQLTR